MVHQNKNIDSSVPWTLLTLRRYCKNTFIGTSKKKVENPRYKTKRKNGLFFGGPLCKHVVMLLIDQIHSKKGFCFPSNPSPDVIFGMHLNNCFSLIKRIDKKYVPNYDSIKALPSVSVSLKS